MPPLCPLPSLLLSTFTLSFLILVPGYPSFAASSTHLSSIIPSSLTLLHGYLATPFPYHSPALTLLFPSVSSQPASPRHLFYHFHLTYTRESTATLCPTPPLVWSSLPPHHNTTTPYPPVIHTHPLHYPQFTFSSRYPAPPSPITILLTSPVPFSIPALPRLTGTLQAFITRAAATTLTFPLIRFNTWRRSNPRRRVSGVGGGGDGGADRCIVKESCEPRQRLSGRQHPLFGRSCPPLTYFTPRESATQDY